jgi:hypothetical protein
MNKTHTNNTLENDAFLADSQQLSDSARKAVNLIMSGTPWGDACFEAADNDPAVADVISCCITNAASDARRQNAKAKYTIVYASDFVSGPDQEVYDNLTSAHRGLENRNNNEDGDKFVIIRADDSESEFNCVLEDGKWIKYT